jgi:8-oxo-dGTP diphosphatase
MSSMSPKPRANPPWTATNSAGYPSPAALAADAVVLTVREHTLLALALKADPLWALPGGFVAPDETPEDTAARKLREKTGLEHIYLEQLATFARPDPDARGWIPTVAYLALVPPDTEPTDSDAAWIPATKRHPLAYDHAEILATAIDRTRGKLWWSNIAVGILPEPFTMAEARVVYEAIADTRYDASTFARDLRATGLIARTGDQPALTGGRPAARYGFENSAPTWGVGRRKRVSQ